VNALRHVHTLLVPDGELVDVHPVSEEQVETDGAVLGTIEEPDWVTVDLPNAESGLRQVVDEGLYALEAETEYDVLEHFDDAEDLIEAKHDIIEGQDRLIGAIRSAQPPLRSRMHVVMRRLHALPENARQQGRSGRRNSAP
jgi:hypothetical protein